MIRYIVVGVGIVALIPILWFAWWLLSPLWSENAVNEAFPDPEAFPLATRAVVPERLNMAEVEAVMAEAAQRMEEVAEAMPAMTGGANAADAPRVRLAGEFRDADAFHRGSGTATVYELGGDGERILRLEDFRVTNGPDLRVLLANAADPEGHSELADAGYTELGELKGNVGSQNYEIPAGVDLSRARSVVIYCNPFRVVFSVATLAEPG